MGLAPPRGGEAGGACRVALGGGRAGGAGLAPPGGGELLSRAGAPRLRVVGRVVRAGRPLAELLLDRFNGASLTSVRPSLAPGDPTTEPSADGK